VGAVQPLLPPIPARRYRQPGRKQAEDRAPHRAPATGCGEPSRAASPVAARPVGCSWPAKE